MDSDIIVGNNFGDIGLVTSGKNVILKKSAHSAAINCLKATDMLAKVRKITFYNALEEAEARLIPLVSFAFLEAACDHYRRG